MTTHHPDYPKLPLTDGTLLKTKIDLAIIGSRGFEYDDAIEKHSVVLFLGIGEYSKLIDSHVFKVLDQTGMIISIPIPPSFMNSKILAWFEVLQQP